MSTNGISVEFGAETSQIKAGSDVACQVVTQAVEAMKAELASLSIVAKESFANIGKDASAAMQMAVASTTQQMAVLSVAARDGLGGVGAQAARAAASVEQIGERAELMSHSTMIGLGELSRGIARVSESGQLGSFAMREFSGSAMRLGSALGMYGGLAAICVMLGGVIVETFTKARREIEATRQKFQEEIGRMANAGKSADLQETLRKLTFGMPFDEKGNLVNISKFAPGAFEGSLADLEAHLDKLNAELPRGAAMASRDVAEEYNKISAALDIARGKAAQLRQAIENVASQPATKTGLMPVVVSATSLSTNPLKELQDTIAAANATEAYTDLMAKPFQQQLDAMRRAYEDFGRNYVATRRRAEDDSQKAQAETFQAAQRDLEKLAIANARVMQQMASDGKKWIDTQAKNWESLFHGITDSWNGAVQRIVVGHDSIKNFWRDMWHEMVRNAALGEFQILQSHLAMWLARKQITTKGVLEEVGLYLAAGLKSIAISAAQAAAAAWAAIAAIPFVGPFIAPVIAAGTLAGVIALGASIRSAAGGYDVPAGLNPVTQLHAQEMVLPADLANRIRGMTDGGNHYHFNVQAWDSRDVKRFVMGHRDHIADAMIRAAKEGRGLG